MKVLIADGSPLIHERIESLLADVPGVTIAGCAVDVERAETMAAACTPDVFILDASLPGGGCLRLLRELGTRPGAGGPVAIVLASPASLPYRRALKQAGAAMILDKVHEMNRLAGVLLSIDRVPAT
ncbi:MAG TPA: response regulator [Desulfobacterales bacterium]|nr:response regulator [Desulfobacterales bacterium]